MFVKGRILRPRPVLSCVLLFLARQSVLTLEIQPRFFAAGLLDPVSSDPRGMMEETSHLAPCGVPMNPMARNLSSSKIHDISNDPTSQGISFFWSRSILIEQESCICSWEEFLSAWEASLKLENPRMTGITFINLSFMFIPITAHTEAQMEMDSLSFSLEKPFVKWNCQIWRLSTRKPSFWKVLLQGRTQSVSVLKTETYHNNCRWSTESCRRKRVFGPWSWWWGLLVRWRSVWRCRWVQRQMKKNSFYTCFLERKLNLDVFQVVMVEVEVALLEVRDTDTAPFQPFPLQ